MAIVIQPNAFSVEVRNHLAQLVPATDWSVDNFGWVAVTRPATTAGQMLKVLVDSPVVIQIVGSNAAQKVMVDGAQVELRTIAGKTTSDGNTLATINRILVLYDTTDCEGRGYVVRDAVGVLIPFPPHLLLGHELGHAAQFVNNEYTTDQKNEEYALNIENLLRQTNVPPLTPRSGHDGGCNAAPPEKPKTPTKTTGCFIATAAYGSPLHPVVGELRSFRDNVLRGTRCGKQFFERFFKAYQQLSDGVVAEMESNGEVREIVRRSLVTPIIQYLRIAHDFPDKPIELAGPTWAPFLAQVRASLEEFAEAVPLPNRLEEIPSTEAAIEIGVALRYQLRSVERRRAWLHELRATGQLPLHPVDLAAATAIRSTLRSFERSSEEMSLICDDKLAKVVTVAAEQFATGN